MAEELFYIDIDLQNQKVKNYTQNPLSQTQIDDITSSLSSSNFGFAIYNTDSNLPGWWNGSNFVYLSDSESIELSHFATTGSNIFTENQIISGGLEVLNGITGSISYAISSSHSLSSSYAEYSNISNIASSSISTSYYNVSQNDVIQYQSNFSISQSQIFDLNIFNPSNLFDDYGFSDSSSFWNTAYGWGDHSTVGYSIGFGTLQQVTDNGATTNNPTTFTNGLTTGNGSVGVLTFDDGNGTEVEANGSQLLFTNNSNSYAVFKNGDALEIISKGADYNANTNTPTLANTDTGKNDVEHKVTVAGTQDFGAGSITFGAGDIISNDGSVYYKKVDNNQGDTSIQSKTGNTLVFTEDALYNENEVDFLTSGDITFNMTSAKKGVVLICYCLGYIPNLIGDYLITAGSFDVNSLNIFTAFYDGNRVLVNIGNSNALSAPSITLEPTNGEILATWTAVTGATDYVLEYDTDSGFSSPIEAYSGGLLTYNITGLTNGTEYYVRVKAEALGQISSGWNSDSETPIIGNILYQDDMDTFDTALWGFNNANGSWDGAVANAYQWTEPSAATIGASFIGGNAQRVDTTGETIVYKFDLEHEDIFTCGELKMQMYGLSPSQNEVTSFQVGGTTSNMQYKGSSGWVDTGLSGTGGWKMVLNSGTVYYYHYNTTTDIWDLLGSRTYSDGTKYPIVRLDNGSVFDEGGVIRYSGHYITDYDYATLNP